jgi:hypothetical protein
MTPIRNWISTEVSWKKKVTEGEGLAAIREAGHGAGLGSANPEIDSNDGKRTHNTNQQLDFHGSLQEINAYQLRKKA